MNAKDRKASVVAELRGLADELETDDCELRDGEMRVDAGIVNGMEPGGVWMEYRHDGLRTYTIRLVTYRATRDRSAESADFRRSSPPYGYIRGYSYDCKGDIHGDDSSVPYPAREGVSAVEKYRKGSRSRHLEASWALEQEADAAIAELEAESAKVDIFIELLKGMVEQLEGDEFEGYDFDELLERARNA